MIQCADTGAEHWWVTCSSA